MTFRPKRHRVIFDKAPQDCFGQVVLEFGQVLAHSQEALYCRFVGWNWHVSDGGYFGKIGLHPFMGKLVPHESDRRGFELKLFSQRAVDRVQHTSPRAALSFGRGRCQRLPFCRHTHTSKYRVLGSFNRLIYGLAWVNTDTKFAVWVFFNQDIRQPICGLGNRPNNLPSSESLFSS